MKHIKKLSALLMCALIALSACITASAADPAIKPTGPYTLKINLYESANQATKEVLSSLATNRGDGATAPTGGSFKASTLAGVTFDIYPANSTKNGKEEGSTAKQVTTDENGVATFTTPTAGTYWVKVNSLPKAVAACLDIKDGFAVDLPMTDVAGTGWLKTVNVYPKVDTVWGEATFKKVDKKGNAITSSSAYFNLYRVDIPDTITSNSTWTEIEAALERVSDWGNVYSKHNTNNTGTFTTGTIPYGAYKLVETQAPAGYALDTTPIYFIIDGLTTTQNIEGVATNVTFNGTYTIGEVKIENEKLGGIEKTLTSGESASIGDTVTWTITGKVPSDWETAGYTEYKITDTLHEAFEYSNESTAKVGEKTVALDYNSTNKIVTLNLITGKQNYSAGDIITITIKATLKPNAALLNGIKNTATLTYSNSGGSKTETADSGEVKTGGYTFKKVGSDNTDKGLAGAKFKVYKSNGTPVTNFRTNAGLSTSPTSDGIVESDANGFVHIYGLAYGDYYLVEVFAPTGYELNGGKINFKITEATSDTAGAADGDPIVNQKKVELPFTGGVGAEVVVASGVLLMVAAGFVLKKRVK